MTSRRAVVLLASILLGVLVACGAPTSGPSPTAPPPAASAASTPSRPPSRLLDPAAFATAITTPGVTTINVHVPYAGDIPGTDRSIPFDQIGARTGELPTDRSAPLALYCRTGPMSAEAARTLAAAGYTDIVELAGGMNAWTNSGRPLTDAGH